MKPDKFTLAFGKEEEPFMCYTDKHRTEKGTRYLEYGVLGARMGPFCIEHWPEATEHIAELRKDRPAEVSADDVQKATRRVMSEYERIRGARSWPGTEGGKR